MYKKGYKKGNEGGFTIHATVDATWSQCCHRNRTQVYSCVKSHDNPPTERRVCVYCEPSLRLNVVSMIHALTIYFCLLYVHTHSGQDSQTVDGANYLKAWSRYLKGYQGTSRPSKYLWCWKLDTKLKQTNSF